MARHGAKNLILASPPGGANQRAKEAVRCLRAEGVSVAVYAADVSDASQLAQVLQSCKHLPTIRGVIQMAMVMRNAMFGSMPLEDWQSSLAPKTRAIWNLHSALEQTDLDFFLMLSSGVGIMGSASQAAYGAASTFLDAFADYRNQVGLPAATIDLGMILGVGYVAEHMIDTEGRSLERQGIEGIPVEQLVALMETLFSSQDRGHATGSVITGLGVWSEAQNKPVFATPRFSHFRRMGANAGMAGPSHGAGSDNATSVRELLRTTQDAAEAVLVVCNAVMQRMSSLLMLPIDDIQESVAMQDYGMDSLVAVEMRNWLFSALGVTMPVLEMMENITLRKLSENILRKALAIDPLLVQDIQI